MSRSHRLFERLIMSRQVDFRHVIWLGARGSSEGRRTWSSHVMYPQLHTPFAHEVHSRQ